MAQDRDSTGRFAGGGARAASIERLASEIVGEYGQVKSRLATTEAAIDSMLRAQGETNRALEKLADRLDERTSTNLPKLIGVGAAVLSLFVTVMVLWSQPGAQRTESNATRLERLAGEIADRGEWMGQVTGTLARLQDHRQIVSERFQVLDSRLDRDVRELRDAVAALRTEVFGRDRFTREDLRKDVAPRLDEFGERLTRLEVGLRTTADMIKETRAEQLRRTQRVYDGPGK